MQPCTNELIPGMSMVMRAWWQSWVLVLFPMPTKYPTANFIKLFMLGNHKAMQKCLEMPALLSLENHYIIIINYRWWKAVQCCMIQ